MPACGPGHQGTRCQLQEHCASCPTCAARHHHLSLFNLLAAPLCRFAGRAVGSGSGEAGCSSCRRPRRPAGLHTAPPRAGQQAEPPRPLAYHSHLKAPTLVRAQPTLATHLSQSCPSRLWPPPGPSHWPIQPCLAPVPHPPANGGRSRQQCSQEGSSIKRVSAWGQGVWPEASMDARLGACQGRAAGVEHVSHHRSATALDLQLLSTHMALEGACRAASAAPAGGS